MGRKPRGWSESGLYHVVARGNNRQSVFREETDYARYLHLFAAACGNNIRLHHYCLMPNHTHLLLSANTPASISQTMHQLQRRYWFHVRRTYHLSGHLWQGRYHSFPIESEGYLLECARYVERNPLQAGLVTDLSLFPWSSYPFYAHSRPAEIVLSPSPGYLAMGVTPEERQSAYRLYVSTNRPYDAARSKSLREITLGA